MPSADHLFDWAVGIVTVVAGWLTTQWAKLRGELRTLELEVIKVQTKAAVLEARFDALPATLREIKDEIKGLRGDFTGEMRALHERIDGKADK